MLNSVVLEIAIGLIFVFLLYSLLATTIKEFIATIFAYRGRMLERGLEQMFDGKNLGYYWWQKWGNAILSVIYRIFHYKTARLNEITHTVFMQKDGFTAKTVSAPPRLVLNKKAAMFASNLTSHPLYKRSAENNWLFKKPAYLSSDTFSDMLIDVLGAQKSTPANAPVLMKDIADFVNNNIPTTNTELKQILTIYIQQANGDFQRFKILLENWYDHTMDRVSGWYKKQASKILLIIGFLLAMIFNAGTLDMISKLNKDEPARDAMIQSATEYVKTHQNAVLPVLDTSHKMPDCTLVQIKANLSAIQSMYNSGIAQHDSTMGLGWDFSHLNTKASGAWYNLPFSIVPSCLDTAYFKTRQVVIQTVTKPRKCIGFLITAFAISLGAPFWFDLLNKFVNLRMSGVKPDDPKKGSDGSKSPGLNQTPIPKPNSFG